MRDGIWSKETLEDKRERPTKEEIKNFLKQLIKNAVNAGWAAHGNTSVPMGGYLSTISKTTLIVALPL